MTGETGTGKSFLSGSVHFNSKRRTRPFITINCANISETLLESELFGHEKGAFTGANKTRVGRLEQGRGGTVFLDEIGEMSPALQAKLPQVLEDKVFERVGGNRTIHSDVRLIAATNKKPEEQVATGELRERTFTTETTCRGCISRPSGNGGNASSPWPTPYCARHYEV